MYVCMYVCMYVHTHTHPHTHMYVSLLETGWPSYPCGVRLWVKLPHAPTIRWQTQIKKKKKQNVSEIQRSKWVKYRGAKKQNVSEVQRTNVSFDTVVGLFRYRGPTQAPQSVHLAYTVTIERYTLYLPHLGRTCNLYSIFFLFCQVQISWGRGSSLARGTVMLLNLLFNFLSGANHLGARLLSRWRHRDDPYPRYANHSRSPLPMY